MSERLRKLGPSNARQYTPGFTLRKIPYAYQVFTVAQGEGPWVRVKATTDEGRPYALQLFDR